MDILIIREPSSVARLVFCVDERHCGARCLADGPQPASGALLLEIGIWEIFPAAGRMRQAVSPLSSSALGGGQITYGGLGVDSTSAIVFTALLGRGQEDERELFRYRPGQPEAEPIGVGVSISDFVFASDNTLLAIGQDRFDEIDRERKLYRIDLESETSTVLLESDALTGAYRLGTDPSGRDVTLTGPHGDVPAQVVRVDLTAGTTEIHSLDPSYGFPADMDILIIPEPSSLALLVLGILALLSSRSCSA